MNSTSDKKKYNILLEIITISYLKNNNRIIKKEISKYSDWKLKIRQRKAISENI